MLGELVRFDEFNLMAICVLVVLVLSVCSEHVPGTEMVQKFGDLMGHEMEGHVLGEIGCLMLIW